MFPAVHCVVGFQAKGDHIGSNSDYHRRVNLSTFGNITRRVHVERSEKPKIFHAAGCRAAAGNAGIKRSFSPEYQSLESVARF